MIVLAGLCLGGKSHAEYIKQPEPFQLSPSDLINIPLQTELVAAAITGVAYEGRIKAIDSYGGATYYTLGIPVKITLPPCAKAGGSETSSFKSPYSTQVITQLVPLRTNPTPIFCTATSATTYTEIVPLKVKRDGNSVVFGQFVLQVDGHILVYTATWTTSDSSGRVIIQYRGWMQ
jgi:hypothetical protein